MSHNKATLGQFYLKMKMGVLVVRHLPSVLQHNTFKI